MKRIKKMLAITMLIALVLGTVIAIPFEANASNETLVYKNDFSSSVGKWEKFGTTAGTLRIENGELKMRSHTKTWHSPALDLYSMVKATGTGTYWVKLTLSYTGTTDVANEARLLIRGNKTNSFLTENNGNYYKVISSVYKTEPNTEMVLYGSFKVLKEDFLERYSSKLLLCIDGIPAGAGVSVSIDDVEIYRLDDTQITNGDFNNLLVGWRPWCSKGEDYLSLDGVAYYNDLWARYIRVKNYGSIACNVDQIFSYYGMGEYTLSFDMRATYLDDDECNKFAVYLSRGTSDYHYRIGYVYPTSYRETFTFTINMSFQLYNTLHPEQNEVFFRIEYKGDTDAEISYDIDNVVLTPKRLESFDVAMLDAGERVRILNRGQNANERTTGMMNLINATPTNAPATCSYISSDTSVVTVDERGLVTPIGGGVATITVTSHNNNITKQWTVAVNNQISTFTQYSQETYSGQTSSHWCWLACAKMLASHYAQVNDATFNDISLRDAFIAVKPNADIDDENQRTGTFFDLEDAIEVFLGKSVTTHRMWTYMSEKEMYNHIDNNELIVLAMTNYKNGDAQPIGHDCVIFGYEYTYNESTGKFSRKMMYFNPSPRAYGVKKKTYESMITYNSSAADLWIWTASLYIEMG